MIFDPGNSRFLGVQYICYLLLGEACVKASLLQENTNFELLISFIKFFCKFRAALFSVSPPGHGCGRFADTKGPHAGSHPADRRTVRLPGPSGDGGSASGGYGGAAYPWGTGHGAE